MARVFIIYILVIFLMNSCDKLEIESNTNIPVVQAYLYTNQSLDSIRIVKILTYNTKGDTNIVINDMDVHVSDGSETYIFNQSLNNPEYFKNSGERLLIEEGKTYEIMFEYNDKQIYATTTSLSIPQNLSISDTVITIDDESERPFWNPESEFDITWTNDNDEYFLIGLQLTDTTSLDQINDNIDDPSTSLFLSPINGSSMSLNTRMIQYYGKYMLILFKVNEEYVELFESYNQNISSLIESPTNIENGKGIFTAMSTDTIYFDVIRD